MSPERDGLVLAVVILVGFVAGAVGAVRNRGSSLMQTQRTDDARRGPVLKPASPRKALRRAAKAARKRNRGRA